MRLFLKKITREKKNAQKKMRTKKNIQMTSRAVFQSSNERAHCFLPSLSLYWTAMFIVVFVCLSKMMADTAGVGLCFEWVKGEIKTGKT